VRYAFAASLPLDLRYTVGVFRYRLVRSLMKLLSRALRVRLEVRGLERLPDEGPYIVVLNHNSAADTPILLLAFPLMEWRFFAVEKWRSHPIFGPIMGWLGAIYIARNEIDRSQLRRALEGMERGTIFGLAPEGTRSRDGRLQRGKEGAAYLASRSGAPIVPVGVVNTNHLFSSVRGLRPTHIIVNIGEPFVIPNLGRRVRARDLAPLTHLIMARIAALLPERHRGYYADSPAVIAISQGKDPWEAVLRGVLEADEGSEAA
jgi:1-acyl-sn-glycerol-3-phosphate acyltransferase